MESNRKVNKSFSLLLLILFRWLTIAENTVPPEELKTAKCELALLEERLDKEYSDLRLVMCHNDVNYGNILYNDAANEENKYFRPSSCYNLFINY